ncbi:MAG: hypothetical protein EON98_07915 [Chitinophagaceae bacterium]|nr:MAG: hypothetical protein EON98_07915 [Chitinophagaceae bacterium]
MSIHFSKIIKAGDRNREFNFTRTHRDGTRYNVNVPDERGNRIFFTMQQENGSWKIIMDLLPQWVLVAEEELQKAIEEENQAAGIGKDGRK